MKVRECMCNNVTWVKPTDSVCNCAKLMSNNHIGCIPVCDDSQNVVGIVTDRDIILRGVACDKDAKNTPISEIMFLHPRHSCKRSGKYDERKSNTQNTSYGK